MKIEMAKINSILSKDMCKYRKHTGNPCKCERFPIRALEVSYIYTCFRHLYILSTLPYNGVVHEQVSCKIL